MPINRKHKRALNRAARAFAELSRDVSDDEEAFNAAIIMMIRSVGLSIGATVAANGHALEAIEEVTRSAGDVLQAAAEEGHAQITAHRHISAGKPH